MGYLKILLALISFFRAYSSLMLNEETCDSLTNQTIKKLTVNCMQISIQNETFNFNYLKDFISGYTMDLTINNKNYYELEKNTLNFTFNITSLNLVSNNILYLQRESFKYLNNLKVLNLNKNKLRIIKKDDFKELTSLSTLWIQDNELVEIEKK